MKCFSITYLLDAQKEEPVEQKHNLSKHKERYSEVGNTAFTQAHDSTKLFILRPKSVKI